MKEFCEEDCMSGIKVCDRHRKIVIGNWQQVIPPRYAIATLADYKTDFADDIKKKLDLFNGILIQGEVGCGKTHLKWAMADWLMYSTHIRSQEHPLPFANIDCKQLIFNLHWHYTGNGDCSVVDYINKIMPQHKVIFFDDFGHGDTTKPEFAANMWNIIIDKLYNDCTRVVFITNFDRKGLVDRVGFYAVDRLKQMCSGNLIELSGKSKRI